MPEPQPRRILVAHNRYQQRGGEDAVVDAEVALLRQHGHEVLEYQRDNVDVQTQSIAATAMQTLWSRRTLADLELLFNSFRPHLLHVHNTLPLISPSIYWAAHRRRVPVVQTLHNFRLMCPQAMLLRNDKICEDCIGKLPWRGVTRRCYRGSAAQSAVLASMLVAHRWAGTWDDKVTRYIALNEFCRAKFIEGGLPARKLVVKPNFIDLAAPTAGPRSGFLFVGRLSAEKGVAVLAAALSQSPDLKAAVAGVGSEAQRLAGVANALLLGALAPAEVYAHMGRALALVLPSLWYENFPRTLVEAFACGLPVIASRIGALAELVDDGVTGLLFSPGDAADLAAKLQWAEAHPTRMAEFGANARATYEATLTGEANYRILCAIYADAIDDVALAAA